MIPSPIKRNDFITLDKDAEQLGRILAVTYPNAIDDLLKKYSLDEGDVIHLVICGLAAVGRVEDAQNAYWYLHDLAKSGKGKSMRESRGQGEIKMERKLRMIESKLGKLTEEFNDDESPEFWDGVEDILDSEGYNLDVITWALDHISDIIKDGSVEKTPEAYAYAISDYIESFDPEEFMDMMDASEYTESRRLRGRMIREGLLSQEREDSQNKQKSDKVALERAAKVVELMKSLDKEHGYTFGVRNTKTEDAAKMLITGEASIPFDQDDRKTLRAIYNGLNKFCATVRKHTFVLKKDCFYDEEKFNELIDYLS